MGHTHKHNVYPIEGKSALKLKSKKLRGFGPNIHSKQFHVRSIIDVLRLFPSLYIKGLYCFNILWFLSWFCSCHFLQELEYYYITAPSQVKRSFNNFKIWRLPPGTMANERVSIFGEMDLCLSICWTPDINECPEIK